MLGLPTHWEQNLLIALLIALPIAFVLPLINHRLRRLRGLNSHISPRRSVYLSLWRQCMSVLLAYVMLLVPGLESVAQGATQYNQLSTTNWASGNRTIEYQYDDNGSCTQKVTKETSTSTVRETLTYDYNLQNKLEKVTKTDYSNAPDVFREITEYTYNDEGIRVKSYYYFIVNSDPRDGEETKVFLIDSYNPTGYAQVLEETTYDASMTFVSRMTYTIGDDVVMQAGFDGSTETWRYMLYDGHGSTRQTTDSSGQITDTFGYDGYGVMLGGNPNRGSSAQTNHLYAGEYYDNDLQQYNLRARYYDSLNGRFNQVDSYKGNRYDPISLHKYLYCHADPINRVDPTGEFDFTISSILKTVTLSVVVTTALYFAYQYPFKRVAVPLYLMAKSSELDEYRKTTATEAIRQYWPAAEKMKQLAEELESKILFVRVLQENRWFEGLHFFNNIFVSERAINTNDSIAVALVIFAEYQHHPNGGRLNEQDAQDEFIRIRRQLPNNVRTQYINSLHHGGTINEY